ncbi:MULTISPECIES: hypothetical protein [unclassified Streptomyces]|uniref:hypothetical protein n=1 Tax=unclassified Streptomyces TaxID=2593676 RepID=UPI0035E1189F
MPVSRFRERSRPASRRVQRAESVLVEQYGGLVRLAYLVLPASLGRHRRVLRAHSLAQRALPRTGGGARPAPGVPAPRGGAEPVAALIGNDLRVAVLRAALKDGRRAGSWAGRAAAVWPPRRLPIVLGLRLFPRSGNADDMALGRVLSGAEPATRGAFVLRHVDGLPEPEVLEMLRAAGADDPAGALRAANRLDLGNGAAAASVLSAAGPSEFDACTVRAQPTDLLRRRRRTRLAGALVLAALVTATALVATTDQDTEGSDVAGSDAARSAYAPAAQDLRRTDPALWADTSRVDFTAWPARGDRADDAALLTRALETWSRPPRGNTNVSFAPGTPTDPPPGSPQLLYAGEVDARTVVLLHDGRRLARYTEPDASGGEPAALSVARVDDADVTTAAAVAVTKRDGAARYLLAPWIAEAGTRDLLRPDDAARDLDVSADGVTEPVPVTPAGGSCERRTVLQLRSSSRIVEDHSFLLADRGGLSPAHLTYTPLPGAGTPPARQPREATGSAALVAWSRLACGLDGLSDEGEPVRAVNLWDFADQRLPQDAGRAVWSCARAVTWRGTDEVSVDLRTGDAAQPVVRARGTAACSRFGQHVVADTHWRSPDGDWYVLAAGSRAVTGLRVTGDVTAESDDRTLAVRAPREAEAKVTGLLRTGEDLAALTGDGDR